MEIKAGEPERAEIDPRYVQLVMQNVIRDVFDALVEYITNSDDSYHRQYLRGERATDGGPITIIIDRRRGVNCIAVRDRAEGMTLDEMRRKIRKIGSRTSADADRGFMGRGAKECAVLGKATFESIKDDKYYKCDFTSNLEFIPYKPPLSASREIRKSLGIPRGNGTAVTLYVDRKKHIPRVENIRTELPYHFSLRDILSSTSPSKVKIVEGLFSESLIYHQPKADLIRNEKYEIIGYPEAFAKMQIWRSSETLNGHGERFRRGGFTIKGERAIHECSMLVDEYEKDPLANKFFGRIDCPYIDKLCKEYDKYREENKKIPEENPCLIIDPNRQKGLRRDHPFTNELLRIPVERLRLLIEEERDKEKQKNIQIVNKETRGRLDRLAKAAGKFIKDKLEEFEEISIDDIVDGQSFTKEGMLIYPTYFKIALGEQKRLGIYIRKTIVQNETKIKITSENNSISIIDSEVELIQHKRRPDIFLSYFKIRGDSITDAVIIKAELSSNKTSNAVAQVVEKITEEHLFSEELEFEHKTYQVKEGKNRVIRLFAMYPEFVTQDTEIMVASSDNDNVTVKGSYQLKLVANSNYASADIVVRWTPLFRQDRGYIKRRSCYAQ